MDAESPQPSAPLVSGERERVHKIEWPVARIGGYLLVATGKAYLPHPLGREFESGLLQR